MMYHAMLPSCQGWYTSLDSIHTPKSIKKKIVGWMLTGVCLNFEDLFLAGLRVEHSVS